MSDLEEKINSIVKYYKNLIIFQYINKPKASATIEALISQIISDGLVFQIEGAFDIDTAVGEQLTILGKYVGVPRTIRGAPVSRTFFEFTDYDIVDVTGFIGFRTYDENPEPGSYFSSYSISENSVYTLTDAELRFLIKVKRNVNNTRSTYANIKKIVYEDFQNELQVFDNKDMSMTLISSLGVSELTLIAIIENILPFPACVDINLFSVEYPDSIFGFTNYDNENSISAGFSLYDNIKVGSLLSYSNEVSL